MIIPDFLQLMHELDDFASESFVSNQDDQLIIKLLE